MGKSFWIFATVIIAALLIGVGRWFLVFNSRGEVATTFLTTATSTHTLLASATSTEGYLTYANQQYHFSLQYPPNLQVTTYGGGGQGLTVAFQDPSTNAGFQVFVTPYNQPQITKARFEMDEPSGVLENPTTIVIDGVSATMFYSTDARMGDTREVWFINGGLLYEVTTYKELDTWLAGIMMTWRFI